MLKKGQAYERIATNYLKQKGLVLVENNYHCRFGEIDLIMMQQDILCFIEVKYRKGSDFGGAAATIHRKKQQKIIKTAQIYLSQNSRFKNQNCRFDAIIIQQPAIGNNMDLNWIQNAFYAE